MLLDPFEEQLYVPTALVQCGDSQRRQGRVVGQKHQYLARLGVFETDTAQLRGRVLGELKGLGSVSYSRRFV